MLTVLSSTGDKLCWFYMQEVQKRNLGLLTMTSLLEPSTQVSTLQTVDVAGTQSSQSHGGTGTAAGDMSLESSMTDDDSSRADVLRPRRQRRHRGADDVFPTHALQRYQVC